MNFIISANTDIGTKKATNQDSLSIKVIKTIQGRMVFGVLCDGMGGLEKGEVASASVVRAFHSWVVDKLPKLCHGPLQDAVIRKQWETIIHEQNERIRSYGARQGVKLGTTVLVMLLTSNRYYILNVGDSRAYVLTDSILQITQDQTLVAREVAMGKLTPKQAEKDPRRSILLQCVGASDQVYPDMFFGDVEKDAVYLLCSDGFRHEITAQEIYGKLQPRILLDEHTMSRNSLELIALNKKRMERDNISIALVRTF